MLPDPYQPVTDLKGVGPALGKHLERLGIRRLIDLFLHLPSRYQDRTRVAALTGIRAGDACLVEGEVVESTIAFGRRRSLVATITDGSGYLTLRFYYFSRAQELGLSTGRFVRAFGEVRFVGRRLEMAHPEYQVFDDTPPPLVPQFTPVYPTTKGVTQNRLRSITQKLIELDWPTAPGTPWEQLAYLHSPPAEASDKTLADAREHIARDELTAYYLVMKHRQSTRKSVPGVPLPSSRQLGRQLLENLGFQLTGAQRRVTREILNDLTRPTPMLRLVQGDVGSGKTVVAAFAAIRAAELDYQTAVMAPTELLAEQHYANFSQWLSPLGIQVALVTGSQTAAVRRDRLARVQSGEVAVVVGTHALFQDQVTFHQLALAIIDEQHRFGVHQRMMLREKGAHPHQLVLTATPIPRTLTMALYADMDVSVIDELPAGRQPIKTTALPDERRDEVAARLASLFARGGQAYWVCTLIEENDDRPEAAAETRFAELTKTLAPYQVDIVHGRLSSEAKSAAMASFKAGDTHLLVATTVIEVGVDVPNATVMVIENPERLGLAQLHQLRGRVGRGDQPSACVLLHGPELTGPARARLDALVESTDGFYLAEQDMKLRGSGDLLGTRQTGDQGFRVADLNEHAHMIPEVVAHGEKLLREHPEEADALLRVWAPADSGHAGV